MNIQPDASSEECREAMAGIPKDAQIVVYCQSAECPYAVKVTRRLIREDFANITHFKGGWDEWERAGRDGKAS